MAMKTYSLTPGSLVLVTGANGYIASHVTHLLLQLGYRVRGTVRQPRPWLDIFFKQKYGDCFESVVVSGLNNPEEIGKLMIGVSGVALIASDTSLSNDPALISAVTESISLMLEIASKQKALTRVVLTSSATACFQHEANKSIKIDRDSYNEASVAAVKCGSPGASMPGLSVYAASKTEGERRAWDWVQKHKPRFVFNTIIPDFNLGATLCPEIGGSSMAIIRRFLQGHGDFMKLFPPVWYVNVEDTARLHVAALLDPTLKSERIFATAAPFSWTEVVEILRGLYPQNNMIPDAPAGDKCSQLDFVEAKKAEQILRDFYGQSGWISIRDSIMAGVSGPVVN